MSSIEMSSEDCFEDCVVAWSEVASTGAASPEFLLMDLSVEVIVTRCVSQKWTPPIIW